MKIRTCDPVSMTSPLSDVGRSIAEMLDIGVLPFPGGLMQQPARAIRLARLWKAASGACSGRISARRA